MKASVFAPAWTTWVGFRYLKSKKSSRFLSFITLLSVSGVGIGVTALLVVLSVMDGFEEELRRRLMTSDLHVLVTPTPDVGGFEAGFVPSTAFPALPAALTEGAKPAIQSIWPIVATEAILRSGHKVAGVELKGLGEERLERLKPQIVETAEAHLLAPGVGGESARMPGVWIGKELAYTLRLIPGDIVTLISPTETEGPMAAVPRLMRFVIEGIYQSGLPEQELHTAFTRAASARAFLRKRDAVSQWEISVRDFNRAPAIAATLRAGLPGFRVKDWIQMNSALFSSLRLERISMFVVLAVIVVVASFNIVTTLTMMVLEKRKEIAILKAMGARHADVGRIFLAEGLMIGGLGVGGGVALAAAISGLLRRYEFIQLPEVYYDRTLPVTFNPLYYAGVAVCALAIVLVAAQYPGRRAARMNPLDGIRAG